MNRALVILFVIMISTPATMNLVGLDGADPANENREMAPPARWTGTWQSATEFPDAFIRWFEDHFGMRAQLVRWFGESRWFLLGVSPSSAVVKGRDGWLYYADDGGLDDYIRKDPLKPAELDAWREALERADDWLRRRHIAFVFTVAPDKHVIYPENLPSSIRPTASASRTDQIYAALASTRVTTVDLRVPLLEAKSRERVYYITDTHWNDRGALVAYQAIIETARRLVPAVPQAWGQHDFIPAGQDVPGKDLAGMLGLRRVLHETDLRLIPRRARRARVVEPPGEEPTSELGSLVTEINDFSLPRAVIFRDSFGSRLVPFLSEHFSRAAYFWQNDFDAEVVLREHPDIVIQEIVGRHLYSFIASPELVPR
jgi:hypothetical protein